MEASEWMRPLLRSMHYVKQHAIGNRESGGKLRAIKIRLLTESARLNISEIGLKSVLMPWRKKMARTVVKKKKKVVLKGRSNVSKGDRNGASIVIEKGKELPVSKLQPYHENPNVGDPEKTAESLKKNGQYRSIVVNIGTHTGRPYEILAGNHTWAGMKKLKHPTISCDLVDVDEDAAEGIMLADNASRDGSRYKEDVLSGILQKRHERLGTLVGTTITDDMLAGLVKKVDEDSTSSGIDKIEDASDQLDGVEDLQDFTFFPSDAPYEIPELRLDKIPTEPPPKLRVFAGHELDGKDVIGQEEWETMDWLSMWHAGSRGINWPKAIPYFYTDDFHFEPIYNDPAKNTKKILNLGIKQTIMPNYTIFPEMPTALWVYAAYRSFYVARYFQEAGLFVIPDIQTGMEDAVMDISLAGIPDGAPVVSTQAQMHKGDKSGIRKKARLLKEAEDRIGFEHIIVYGHTDAQKVIDYANFDAEVLFVTARTARRREYLNSGSTINSQKIAKKRKKVVKK